MPAPLRILSIDWDYFFPDSQPYDMGHSENHSMILANVLWHNRTAAHNLITQEPLLETYIPTIPTKFWDIITNKPIVTVAESHLRIWELIQKKFACQVTSLDAHHDCGYKKLQDYVDCSNWAAWGLEFKYIGRLDLHYPAWRRAAGEGRRQAKPTSVSYKLPAPAPYDHIFICRSGAWTPPWFDQTFLNFVRVPNTPTFLDDMIPRMSMEDALKARKENQAMWKKSLEINVTH